MVSLLLAALVVAGLLAPPAGAMPDSRPSVYGGTEVLGTPYIAAIGYADADDPQWWATECSAVLWRPTILLTAAHCVSLMPMRETTRRLRVWPVGQRAPNGYQSAKVYAGPKVVKVWRPSTYIDLTQHPELPDQPEHDIAVIVLDRALGRSAVARLATYEEMWRWAVAHDGLVHQGYGWTSAQNTDMTVPHQTELAMHGFGWFPGGAAYWAQMTPTAGLCPGDSGSPDLRATNTGTVLLGVLSGTEQCREQPSADFLSRSYAAMGYLPLLNRALKSAGYKPIPGEPEAVTVEVGGRDVMVRWQPPLLSPRTVVAYDVLDASGAIVCTSRRLFCVVQGLAPGTYGFTVRSRNADGEGQAFPVYAPEVTVG